MKRLFTFVAALSLTATTLVAQTTEKMFGTDKKETVSFGVRAGFNLSNVYGRYDIGEGLDLGTRAGWQVGAVADIALFNGFYLQPGLFFTTRGGHSRYVEEDEGYKIVATQNFRPVYMQIPVLASFRTYLASDVRLQLNVGPYFSIGLGGDVKDYSLVTGNGESEKELDKTPYFGKSTDNKAHFGQSRFDMGLSMGVGVTFKKHYFVGIQYDWGWVNTAIRDKDYGWGEYAKFRNSNFAIQLGYNF